MLHKSQVSLLGIRKINYSRLNKLKAIYTPIFLNHLKPTHRPKVAAKDLIFHKESFLKKNADYECYS